MKIESQEISLPLLKEKEIRLFVKRLDKVHPFISGNKCFARTNSSQTVSISSAGSCFLRELAKKTQIFSKNQVSEYGT